MRSLAERPPAPSSLADFAKLPKQWEAYLRDHFGFRDQLISLYLLLDRRLIGAGGDQVLRGAHGQLFFLGDGALQKSKGTRRDIQAVEWTADLVRRMSDYAKRKKIKFLFASPPDAMTIAQQDLPDWARNDGRATEYDLLLAALKQRGVPALDLRPVIRAAGNYDRTFKRLDTHWTPFGALTAFNAIAQAQGHRDWILKPAAVLGERQTVTSGDLARILGDNGLSPDEFRPNALPEGPVWLVSPRPFRSWLSVGSRVAPSTVVIIGDSFTQFFFWPLLTRTAGRYGFVHRWACEFDWRLVERFEPQEIWFMPGERVMLCPVGVQPLYAEGLR